MSVSRITNLAGLLHCETGTGYLHLRRRPPTDGELVADLKDKWSKGAGASELAATLDVAFGPQPDIAEPIPCTFQTRIFGDQTVRLDVKPPKGRKFKFQATGVGEPQALLVVDGEVVAEYDFDVLPVHVGDKFHVEVYNRFA